MRNAFRHLLVAAAVAGCGQKAPESAAANKASERHPIEGAWRLVERKLGGAEGALNSSPQPGVRMFVDGHSCLVRVDATEPRPLPDSTMTPAELAAIWGPFTGQCARYQISADTVTERFFVSKLPEGMTDQSLQKSTFRIVGDTLWYSSVFNQAGPVAVPGYSKFIRLGPQS